MRKIIIAVVMLMPILAMAQSADIKLGYVNKQDLFLVMPDLKVAQEKSDSLSKQYEDMLVKMQEEYTKKLEEYQKKRSTMTEAMQQIQEEELVTMQQRIQTAYTTAEKDVQMKNQEYLTPIQERLVKAITAVGEKGGYTYVFDATALLYVSPKAVNLNEEVKKELGIK